MSKTAFVKCLVPLLCVLTMGGVAAQELKLTGCEIIHPTGLIVAVTDTKIAVDNFPLGGKIQLIFDQEVFRNTDRTVFVMKVDSTGVPQEDPVRVPVEVNGNTVTLDLSAARLERMDFDFIPDESYLKSGSKYQVFVPWNFVQTADKEGLDHNYGFLLNTRTQNKVDTINTFLDESGNCETDITLCDKVLSVREMNETSIWDALTFLFSLRLSIFYKGEWKV